jgi:hypothetical protein
MNICKAQTSLLACPSRVGGDTLYLTQNRSRKITLRVKPQGCLRVPSLKPVHRAGDGSHTLAASRLFTCQRAGHLRVQGDRNSFRHYCRDATSRRVASPWVAECYKCFPPCQSAVQNSSATCCGRVSNHSKQGRGILSTVSAVSTAGCHRSTIHKNLKFRELLDADPITTRK